MFPEETDSCVNNCFIGYGYGWMGLSLNLAKRRERASFYTKVSLCPKSAIYCRVRHWWLPDCPRQLNAVVGHPLTFRWLSFRATNLPTWSPCVFPCINWNMTKKHKHDKKLLNKNPSNHSEIMCSHFTWSDCPTGLTSETFMLNPVLFEIMTYFTLIIWDIMLYGRILYSYSLISRNTSRNKVFINYKTLWYQNGKN